jgi:hypothetical protein
MTSVYECDNSLQQASSDRQFRHIFLPFVVQMTGSLLEENALKIVSRLEAPQPKKAKMQKCKKNHRCPKYEHV